MKPENVNPGNFKVEKVLYNDNDFSVAYGIWDGGEKRIGLRWNGDDKDAGYPKTFGNPMWFIFTENLNIDFLKSILNNKNSDNAKIIEVLSEIL